MAAKANEVTVRGWANVGKYGGLLRGLRRGRYFIGRTGALWELIDTDADGDIIHTGTLDECVCAAVAP